MTWEWSKASALILPTASRFLESWASRATEQTMPQNKVRIGVSVSEHEQPDGAVGRGSVPPRPPYRAGAGKRGVPFPHGPCDSR